MKLQLSDGTNLTLDDSLTDDEAMQLWYSAEDQLKSESSDNLKVNEPVEPPVAQETEQPVAEQGIAGKALDWMMKPEPQKPVDTSIDNQELSTTEEAYQRAKKFAAELYNSPIETYRKSAEDLSLSMGKGLISIPEFITGVADIASGGKVGKALEDNGVNFQEAKDWLTSRQTSEEQAAAKERESEPTFGGTAKSMVMHPLSTINAAVESLPASYVGGRIGGAVQGIKALGKASGMLGAGAGEFIVGSGQAEEGIRQQTPDGLTTPAQSASAVGAGAADAFLAGIGSVAAKKLGISDIDTLSAGTGSATTAVRNIYKQILLSMGVEGGEEISQSAAEKVIENYALDKPSLFEGVPNAAAIGLVTGATMGGGHALISELEKDKPQPEDTPIAESMLRGGLPTSEPTQPQTEPPDNEALRAYREVFSDANLNPTPAAKTADTTAPIVDNETIANDVINSDTLDDALQTFNNTVEANTYGHEVNMEYANKIADRFTSKKEIEIQDKDYQDSVQLENQLSTVRDELAYKKFQTAFEEAQKQGSQGELDILIANRAKIIQAEVDAKKQQLKEVFEASVPSTNTVIENEQWARTRNNRNAVIQMVFDRNLPAENIFPAIKAELKRQGFNDTNLSQDDIDSYNLLKAYDQNNTTINKEPVSFGGQPVAARSASEVEFYNTGTNKVDKQGDIIVDALGEQGANAGEQFTGGQGQDVVTNFVSPETPVRQESDALRKVDEWVSNGATYKNGMLFDTKGKKFVLNKAQREYYLNTRPAPIANAPVDIGEVENTPPKRYMGVKQQGVNAGEQITGFIGQDQISGVEEPNEPISELEKAKQRVDTLDATRGGTPTPASKAIPPRDVNIINSLINDDDMLIEGIYNRGADSTMRSVSLYETNTGDIEIQVRSNTAGQRQGGAREAWKEDKERKYLLSEIENLLKPEIVTAIKESITRSNAEEASTTPPTAAETQAAEPKGTINNPILKKNGRAFTSQQGAQTHIRTNSELSKDTHTWVKLGDEKYGIVTKDQVVSKATNPAANLNKVQGNEELRVFIQKLGGLSRVEMKERGFTDYKGNTRLFNNGVRSRTFDDMATVLREDYGFSDINGANDLETALWGSLNGKPYYGYEGIDNAIDKMAADRADQEQQQQDELLNTYTNEEVNAILDAQTQAEKDKIIADIKAEKKRKADLEVDSVVDEMLGKGMTTSGDLFAPERKGKATVGREVTIEGEQLANSPLELKKLYPNHWFYGDKGAQSKFDETEIDYETQYPNLESVSLINTDSNIGGFYDQVEQAIYQTSQSDRTTLHELGHAIHHQLLNYRKLTEDERATLKELILGDAEANHPYLASDKELVAEFNLYAHVFPVKAKAYAPELYKELVDGRKDVSIKLGSQDNKALTAALKQANVTIEKGYGEEEEEQIKLKLTQKELDNYDKYKVNRYNENKNDVINFLNEIGGWTFNLLKESKDFLVVPIVSLNRNVTYALISKAKPEVRFGSIIFLNNDGQIARVKNYSRIARNVFGKEKGQEIAFDTALNPEVLAEYKANLREAKLSSDSIVDKVDSLKSLSHLTTSEDRASQLKDILGDVWTKAVDKSNKSNIKFSKAKASKSDDAKYLAAVEAGDMESAQAMVDDAAENAGYGKSDYQMSHEAPNRNDYPITDLTSIYPEDIYSSNATTYYGDGQPSDSEAMAKLQRARGKKANAPIMVYRAVPKDVKESMPRNGDWVSTTRAYAEEHGKRWLPEGYRVMEIVTTVGNIFTDGNSIHELGFDDGKDYGYANTKNNRKLADPVTYDDNGEVIPLSKRFNKRSDDIRFSKTAKKVLDENPLAIIHNLSLGNLAHADKMGGIAVPSVAIVNQKYPLSGFGEITLIGDTSQFAPEVSTKNKYFNADMPAHYFEGKIGRAVDIGEFSGALVPKGKEYDEAVKILNANGITKIKRYTEGDAQSRSDALLNFSDLLFGKNQQPATNTHTEQSLKEGLTKAGDDAYGKGWTDKLLSTGMFEIISDEQAQAIIEESTGTKFALVGDRSAANTQIDTTMGAYAAVARNLFAKIPNLKNILDYGAGKGRGTASVFRALTNKGLDVNVKSYEPFPENWAKSLTDEPDFTNADNIKDGSQDAVVNLNVLNVVPRAIRDDIVKNIGRILKDGGVGVISSRRWKGDVDTIKPANSKAGEEPNSFYVTRKLKGVEQTNYQKGIEPDELVAYVQELLPDFDVRKINGYGASAVIIQKSGGTPILDSILKPVKKEKVEIGSAETEALRKEAKELGAGERYSEFGVGKKMGDEVYLHRDYEGVLPQGDLADAKERIDDFEYNLIRYNTKTGAIGFFNSPDFDTSPEPINGNLIVVEPDGTIRTVDLNKNPDKQAIYHHKWEWVKDDYKGFDVKQSIERSIAWQKVVNREGIDRKRIGFQGVWQNEVLQPFDIKYSKNGDIEAFFNPADGKTYFVAENIDKEKDLHYLMMHEVSVHMLKMGTNEAEFENFLKETDNLVKVKNPAAMQGRQDALDADTPEEDLREETLAYLIKYAPKLKIVQRFKAWLKNALRNMSKIFPASQKLGFIQWANNLSDQDLLYIAEATLRKAPEMLVAQRQDTGNVKFSLAQNEENLFNLPAETKFQFMRKWIQDDLLRIRIVMDKIREQGGKVDESNDVVLAMEAAGNIAANQLESLKERFIQPLIDRMAKMNVNKDEIGLLLYAKGAPSRNAYIQSINPTFRKLGEGGSGMTDAESSAIIERYKETMGDKYPEFEKLVDDWQNIQNIVKRILVQSGDISPEQAEAWDNASDYHVPMKGFEEVDEITGKATKKSSRGNIGQGFSISGKFDRKMLGRQSRASQIVENIVMNLERAVIRSSKMYTQSVLYKLIEDNPDAKLWENEVTPMQPIMGKAKAQYVMYFNGSEIGQRDTLKDARRYVEAETARTGQSKREYEIIKVGGEPQVTLMKKPYDQNEEISYWRNGKQVRITVNDPEFVQAFNRLGDENIYSMFKVMGAFNRFLRHAYTILNPVFIIANGVMVDPAVALYTNTARKGFKYASTVLAKTPIASLQLAKYMAKGTSGNAQWDNTIKSYLDNGGKSGTAFISSIEQKSDELNLAVLKSKMTDTKFYEYPLDKLKLMVVDNKLANLMKYLGEVGETATRLSTFKVAVDNGMTPQEAAKIARNVTINFNRRGIVGRELGAMYLFLNASIQGTENLVDATIRGEHKAQATAILSSYVALGYLLALLGGDDGDDDLIPEEEKNRYVSIVLDKETGLRVNWKLAYGLSFFKDVGTAIHRIQAGGDVEKITNKLMSSFFGNFAYVNPMVSGEWDSKDLMAGMIPTFGRIPYSVINNRNQWGKPIYPEDVYNTTVPDSEKEWSTTRGTMYSDFAKWMNKVTGGTKVESGLVDVSPETMKYLTNALTGSAGTQVYKFVNSIYTSSMNAEEMGLHNLPIVSGFVKEDTVDAYRRVYNSQRKEAKDIYDKFKKYEKLGDDEATDKFTSKHQPTLDFYDETKSIIKEVKDLRDKQDEARVEGDKALVKELEAEEKQLLIEYSYQYNQRQ